MRHVHKVLMLLVLLALVGCDHATKHVAKTALEGRAPLTLIDGVLGIKYAENRGVAFSMLHWLPERVGAPLLGTLGVIALTAISIVWWKRERSSWAEHAGFALIVSGAVGNLIDRAARGYVVDFIHLHFWPIFNVADVWIVAGALLLALSAWRIRKAPLSESGTAGAGAPAASEGPDQPVP